MKMKIQPIRTYGYLVKAVLRGKFIAMRAYMKKKKRNQREILNK
jgi:hypothetical protein